MNNKKIAVVSGGARGLGIEIGRQLAQTGEIEPVLAARDEAKARAVAAQFAQEGLTAHAAQLDVTSDDSVAALAERLRAEHGRVDILVNNAAILYEFEPGALAVTIEQITTHVDTNAYGALRLSQALIPVMRDNGYGRVVNVTSEMGSLEKSLADFAPPAAAYRISKVALHMISQLLARDVAADNIVVNACSPGLVQTDMGPPDAPMTPEQGARTPVWLATLGDDGPRGKYFAEMRWNGMPHEIPW